MTGEQRRGEDPAPRILIADDDPEVLELYRLALTAHGVRVQAMATDGDGAVERFRQQAGELDAVLLDHHMPNRSGLEAAREILRIDPMAVVLLVSANESIREQAIAAGVRGFWRKPFDLRNLAREIERLCRSQGGGGSALPGTRHAAPPGGYLMAGQLGSKGSYRRAPPARCRNAGGHQQRDARSRPVKKRGA